MRLLITTQKHADAASLIEDVRTVGTKLQAAKPVGARGRGTDACLLHLQPRHRGGGVTGRGQPGCMLGLLRESEEALAF